MPKYQSFVFENWQFNEAERLLTLHYSFDSQDFFVETYRFDFEFVNYNQLAFARACEMLFFMAGVSYYKMYLPANIVVKSGTLDNTAAEFLAKTYQRGLGEFFYVNKLDPDTEIPFMATTPDKLQPVTVAADGLLIGIGGGKDSLMSVELLKQHYPRIATWSLNHRAQLEPLIKRIGLEHFWVERAWDPLIAQHNEQGAYNGHVPISAIFACVGTVVAVLSGYRDVVVSNEASANEPTLMYKGHAINHQYSKSLEFEQDYHALLAKNYDQTLRYYSFLRPLSELYIVELFSKHYFNTYKDVFSSCNRAFVHGSNELFWCGECAKCAFMFLMLTPFNDISDIEALWQGKNLLQEPRLEATYNQLLGIAGDKPLDCVGEVKESRAAMRLAQKLYPQLNKYSFSIPPEYDYRQLATHSMPAELYTILQQTTQRP